MIYKDGLNLFAVTTVFTNLGQRKAPFLHVAGKEIKKGFL